MRIDLNSDLGESFGRYTLGCDDRLVPLVTSVNIACGFHAGDPLVMDKTVAIAKAAGTAIGAHPAFPDLNGFGRRNMSLSYDELKACVLYQIGALDAFAKAHQLSLQHVKPHGAMYNMAAKDIDMAKAVCEAVKSYDPNLIILAQESGCLYQEACKCGLRTAAEVFADRAYEEDGTLVSRKKPGSVISDPEEVIQRVLLMIKEKKIMTVTGRTIDVKVDSICVHGDNEASLLLIQSLRAAFEKENIQLQAFGL